ncbi:MAG: iron ABC transporter permease [Jannaschia helgolandensis]|jgi:iron(III) transport system permease protein|uniref:Iron(III) transport system permease protein n=1 Tax=Jannaschia helgolandensis TaxID=188906 RepID=A0A1H7M929_9RHOB|nr:iron ABC transporter permease [Jannaschia helgolandensis]SEL07448.1 iron(III) transport system permease protein [Jannaschia helgolandensis]
MSDGNTQARLLRWPDLWSAGALAIAGLVLVPILAVVWMAMNPSENIWPHLMATVLPRYLANTLILMTGVGAFAAVVGTGTAWLVAMHEFPGRRWLSWAMLMPLAIPAYVGAYALVNFLDYAGPVQVALRSTFGWTNAADYAFPAIRSLPFAVLVIGLSLYPYVFLLARAAFAEQSGAGYEVARALGAGPWRRFASVGLPLARPAIAAGVAVVMMESVNDFGVVDFFGVQTLTTGIFTVWLQGGNAGGAAQIACVILLVIAGLVLLERKSRARRRFWQAARSQRPVERTAITGPKAWLATLACVLPLSLGFGFPVMVMGWHAVFQANGWLAPGLAGALLNTLTVAGTAAILTVGLALFMTYGVRMTGRALPRLLLPVTTVGYAAPGAVLGLGVLIPLAALDNRVADGILAVTGWDPGLILTGTSIALIFAYVVRFFAIGQGAADAALGRIPPSLPLAARSLGQGPGGVLRRIHLPLMRGSVMMALLLVFVDAMKELPATLLLRPFGFDTLATRVHDQASLERLSQAAPAALVITAVGLVAVLLLARADAAR